jgi:DNA polymerase III epsilon subunit-like protein
MRLVRGDDTITPENPHNALSDARALRDWFQRKAQESAQEWRDLPQDTRHAILGIGY